MQIQDLLMTTYRQIRLYGDIEYDDTDTKNNIRTIIIMKEEDNKYPRYMIKVKDGYVTEISIINGGEII